MLGAFFAAGVVDEVFCYQAPLLICPGRSSVDGLDIGTLSDALRLVPDDTETPAVSRLGPDFLLHFATTDQTPAEPGSRRIRHAAAADPQPSPTNT